MSHLDKKADKAKQNELKSEYRSLLIKDVWGANRKMVDHCMKQISRVVELDAGLIVIEKPRIKTKFCFGYHLSRFNDDDYDRATDAAKYARESVEYFKRENLREEIRVLEALKDDDLKLYSRKHYCSSPLGSRCRALVSRETWEDLKPYEQDDFIPITDEERESIIREHEIALADFEKRLDSYLKRYGLSKVDTWTYWMDE